MWLICSTYDECDSIYFFIVFFFLWNLYEYVESEKAHATSAGSSHAEARTRARSSQKPPKYFTSRHVFRPNFQSCSTTLVIHFPFSKLSLLVVAKHKNKSKRRYYLSCSLEWSMDTSCLLSEIETLIDSNSIYFNREMQLKRIASRLLNVQLWKPSFFDGTLCCRSKSQPRYDELHKLSANWFNLEAAAFP